jgi:hypothetical protein
MPDSHTAYMNKIRNHSKTAWPRATSAFEARKKTETKDRYKIILVGLAVCAIAVVIIFTFMSHQAQKQQAAWCHDHGYANYATKDGFCVGPGGKLIRVGGNN